MFASLTQVTVAVPFDPPHTITIRKLTGKEIDTAQAANMANAAAGMLGRQWHERVKRQMRKGIEAMHLPALTPEQVAEREHEAVLVELDHPLNGFDRYEVIRAGLVSWTYDTGKTDAAIKAARVKAIADLDDEGADFVAAEIIRLTKPALFLSAAEREAAEVKG